MSTSSKFYYHIHSSPGERISLFQKNLKWINERIPHYQKFGQEITIESINEWFALHGVILTARNEEDELVGFMVIGKGQTLSGAVLVDIQHFVVQESSIADQIADVLWNGLRLELGPKPPCSIRAVAKTLDRVVIDVLTKNGLKYTEAGAYVYIPSPSSQPQ